MAHRTPWWYYLLPIKGGAQRNLRGTYLAVYESFKSSFQGLFITGHKTLILLRRHLTPCPMAGKCHPHHGGGCTRPGAMTIVAGIYAQRHVLSLGPEY